MTIPFVDLAAGHAALRTELVAAFERVAQSGDFILGEDVALFEREWAAYCGVTHAIGTDSGLSALELALRALDIGPGDEVVTAANTFVATVLAIAHVGARPVLVDVDPATATLDVEQTAAAITPRTRALVPVHLYGQPADMGPLMALARKHDLRVVEDACQAHGARYRGARAGSFGHAAAFSFYPAKNLGAFGDAGAVVTNDDECAERIRMLRNYGQRAKYDHAVLGHNRRLDTVQASILRLKLQRLDEWNEARRECAGRYLASLDGADVTPPTTRVDVEHVWHLFVVRSPARDALRAHLAENGISTGIHYPVPVHLLDACRGLGYRRGDFPVTERLADEILSLPMYPGLSADAVDRVAETVRAFAAADAGEPTPGRGEQLGAHAVA